MEGTVDLGVPWGASSRMPQQAEPVKAAVLCLAFAYGEAHNLAGIMVSPIRRWGRARRATRSASGALATKSPQNVVGWLSCPGWAAQVPVCYQPWQLRQDEDDAKTLVELAMADLWMHALVHQHEATERISGQL